MTTTPTAQPFRGYRTTVRPEWLDYNGHMNDSAYGIVCTQANELFLEALGLSADYQAATHHAMFTVEAHLRYLAEVGPDDELEAETLLVDHGPKRLHVHTTIHRSDGTAALTGEYLFLHVDQGTGRVVAMPSDREQAVQEMASSQEDMALPEDVGKGIR